MSTKQSTMDYIIDQLADAGGIRARKMFGEYALYCDDKVVALVCDDMLFVKITEAGRKFVGDQFEAGHAYPGARESILVNEEKIENREWLSELIRCTADALPFSKPKKRKNNLIK